MIETLQVRRWYGAVALAMALSATGCVGAEGSSEAKTPAAMRAHQARELLERGHLLAQHGDLTRASQYLVAALDSGATEAEVLPLLMRVYVAGSRFRLAIELGEETLTRHPKQIALRYLVGTLYSAIGEGVPARWHLARVVAERPDMATAHFALGVVMRDSLGDPAGADRHFRRYLELDPMGGHVSEAEGSLLKDVR